MSRKEVVAAGTKLWRSLVGNDWRSVEIDGQPAQEESPFGPERMKPLRDQASEGRANPKGLPYLYLATDRDTAVAEVRPAVGAFVSIAQLKVTRPLVIVDFSKEKRRLIVYGAEPGPKERESAVWRDMNAAFSRPVVPSDLAAEYVPTQVVAEILRKSGFDGICYQSAPRQGKNVAIFDLDGAEVINCTLFKVEKARFRLTEWS